jgi:catechol 2,3-dioxygenase-like lactoylglutathione lyase family enzyme
MAGELSERAKRYLAQTPDTPIALTGIDHVVILVGNMDEAMQFYCEVLGCRPGYSYPAFAMEQVWAGGELLVLLDTSDPGAAYARPEIEGGRNVDHICLSMQHCDREKLRAHFKKHGVTVDREAVHGGARGMGEATYIFDPWGFKIEIKGPPLI